MPRNLDDRHIARAASDIMYQAARETRATGRGNVSSVNEDGSAVVILPNGGTTTIQPVSQYQFARGQSLVLFRTGNNFEAAGPSGYSGGRGASFVEP